MKTFLLSIAPLAAFVAPAFGADEGPANRLLVESARFVQSAERATSGAQRSDRFRRAGTRVQQIVSNHPDSSIAVKLVSGQSVGNISFDRIAKGLASAEPCDGALDERPTHDCTFEKAISAGETAAARKASRNYHDRRAFDEEKARQLEAERAIVEAIRGDFSSALKILAALEEQLPDSREYFDAVGPVACKLALAGYDAESRDLFERAISHAREAYSPGWWLRRLARDQACAGHFEDALETAGRVSTVGGTGGTIADIAEVALDDGLTVPAAAILENLPGSFHFGHDSPKVRSAVVRALARLGLAHAREGDRRAAVAAFERALDTAGDGRRHWSEIGEAAIRNRYGFGPTRGPGARARDAVGDLVTIATAMAEAGMFEHAERTLADADRSAGEEPGALAEIAEARFRIGNGDSANQALARAEQAAVSDAWASAWRAFLAGSPGPGCSYDYEWFRKANAFKELVEEMDFSLPPCENGPSFTERVNLATAYLAQGDHAEADRALSCGLLSWPVPVEMYPDPSMQWAYVIPSSSYEDTTGLTVPLLESYGFAVVPALVKGEQVRTHATWTALVGDALEAPKGEVAAAAAIGSVELCQHFFGELCTGSVSDRVIEANPLTAALKYKYDSVKISVDTLAYLDFGWWAPKSFTPDYPDALRAALARKLAHRNDFDNAVRIASEIANPNRRAELLTELASLQMKRGLVREARATLVRASAAAEELPEDFPEAPSSLWSEPSDPPPTVQDRAIRFAEIAQVLGELLPYE